MKKSLSTIKMEKEMTEKNFRYNRFLVLRYSLALFFFVNLFWLLGLVISKSIFVLVPSVLILLACVSIYEFLKLYGDKRNDVGKQLQGSERFFRVQTTITGSLIVLIICNIKTQDLFPFIVNSQEAHTTLILLLFIGLGLSVYCLKRINKIKKNLDKHYGYIQEYERLI